MEKTFAITTKALATLKANDQGHTEATFTVTNNTARPVRGLARTRVADSTKEEWLRISGESDRDFAPGVSQDFVVTFDKPVSPPTPTAPKAAGAQPAATPPAADSAVADKYGFIFYVSSATNPDEDSTDGPVIQVELPTPKPQPLKKQFPWILIPIAAVVLIGIGVGAYFMFRSKDVTVPNVVGKTLDQAKLDLAAANLTPIELEVQITGQHPVGEVIGQDPKPDSAVKKESEVKLITEGAVPTVEVPDVTTKPISEAKALLTEKGFSVVETGTDVTGALQADHVASQDPGGGQQAKSGSTVNLVVAVLRVVKVPDVTYKPTNIAQQLLSSAGLKFIMKDPQLAPASANMAPGNILSQNPTKDTEVPLGATVELVAAAPTTNVPYVVGKKIAEATVALQTAGLTIGNVSGTVNEGNAGTVVITSQQPGYNTSVAKGSKVDVSVPQICGPFVRCRTLIMDTQTLYQVSPALRMRQP